MEQRRDGGRGEQGAGEGTAQGTAQVLRQGTMVGERGVYGTGPWVPGMAACRVRGRGRAEACGMDVGVVARGV